MRTQTQSTPSPNPPPFISIGRRHWMREGDVLKTTYQKHRSAPRDADVTTPHPKKHWLRVAWVFLVLALIFACTVSMLGACVVAG